MYYVHVPKCFHSSLGYGQKKAGKKRKVPPENQKDIRSFIKGKENSPSTSSNNSARGGGEKGNIFGFGGTSFGGPSQSGSGGLKTKGKTGAMVVNPGWKTPKDNSNPGKVIVPKATTAATSMLVSSSQSNATSSESHQTSSDLVRQQMREFWSKKCEGTTKVTPPDQDTAKCSDCPVCGDKVLSSVINQHLDDCLTKESMKCDSDSKICPKCRREVLKDEFAYHKQMCL